MFSGVYECVVVVFVVVVVGERVWLPPPLGWVVCRERCEGFETFDGVQGSKVRTFGSSVARFLRQREEGTNLVVAVRVWSAFSFSSVSCPEHEQGD